MLVHLGANVYGKSRAFVRAHYQNRVRERARAREAI